jgi:CHRD domain-containing protein
MRKIHFLSLTVAAWLAGGGFSTAADFVVHARGGDEVPPRATKAQGQAVLELSDDGQSLHLRLIVANIDNVVAAHLHKAPAGTNGGIVVNLFLGGVPGSGPVSGILVEDDIQASDLVGDLAGQPLETLLSEITAGNIYLNVHTNDGVDPANTGPGDFPGGEIRGQVRAVEGD